MYSEGEPLVVMLCQACGDAIAEEITKISIYGSAEPAEGFTQPVGDGKELH